MHYEIAEPVLHEYDAGESGITVPAQLTVGSLSQNVVAKLDTGASYCIFRRGIGEALGLDVESGSPQWIGTVTGAFLTFGHEVTLTTLGLEFDVTVYFARDVEIKRDVLGRFGWLQQVKLGLVDYEGKLYLNRYGAT
ncbi:MAG: hypothetical protein M3X11_09920 [Acidobacteriota bacterium]|nr:hypothetical protein [Acidobacteriota bacterium]